MTRMKEMLDIRSYKKLKLVNPLGKMSVWDILMGSTPEHENDFSVPRTSMGINLDAMMQFVNPMSWIKRSGMANLMVSNLVASPLISAVILMRSGVRAGLTGMDTAGTQMLGMASF